MTEQFKSYIKCNKYKQKITQTQWGYRCQFLFLIEYRHNIRFNYQQQFNLITTHNGDNTWEWHRIGRLRVVYISQILMFFKLIGITTSTTTSTLVPESNHKNCPCVETDIYHTNWTIRANSTKSQNCRPGAIGMASWSCDLNDNGCYFRTKQPNFSDCQSKELREIANNVNFNFHTHSIGWCNI